MIGANIATTEQTPGQESTPIPIRRFKTREVIELIQRNAFLVRLNTMPTHKLLIIYARQSTKEQVINNKKSTQQQTDDLLLLGIKYGWSQDDTVIFIENYVTRDGKLTDRIRNASGRLRIN